MRGNAAVQGVPVKFASKLDAAANATATVLVLAGATESFVLVGIEWSYQGGTPDGILAVQADGFGLKSFDISTEQHGQLDFSKMGPMGGIPLLMGADLGVSLSAGGVGITGKVNVTYR